MNNHIKSFNHRRMEVFFFKNYLLKKEIVFLRVISAFYVASTVAMFINLMALKCRRKAEQENENLVWR